MNTINKFSIRLSELMTEKSLNQVGLQNATGLSNQAISFWLRSLREPSMSSLIVLANFFDCSIDYLVGRED